MLEDNNIAFDKSDFRLQSVSASFSQLLSKEQQNKDNPLDGVEGLIYTIPLSDYQQIVPEASVSDNDVILTNYGGYMAEMFPLEKDRDVVVTPGGPEVTKEETLHVKDVQHESIISGTVTSGPGGPIFVVSDALFEKLATYSSASEWHKQTSIKIKNKSDLGQAEKLYIQLNEENYSNFIQSYEEARKGNIETLGITIFTAAFLGLAFLMTTGSILYFKQMSEAEEERGSYTILRKIGFAEKDIMKG
ncbi:ABC transporter permease, partial [Lysinibacillus xylanilyticus]